MKLKLTVTEFFDKVEDKYINKAETPIIERTDERGVIHPAENGGGYKH